MTLPRRLINVAGTLAVVVALVAGTLLIALPVYLESIEVRNEKAEVAAANRLLVAQIEGLLAKKAEMPQRKAQLDDLREQLPHIPQLDDLAQLSLRAADKTDGKMESLSFGDPAPFVPRATSEVLSSLPKTSTDVASDKPADPAAPGEGSVDADQATPTPGATPGGSADAEHLQVPVTITVTVDDTAAAIRYLDELRTGPRLLQIDTASGEIDTDTDEVSLTVTGLVFVRLN